MGKRGPRPKSNAMKVLSGKLPVEKKYLEELNKQFDPPDAPTHFKDRERRIWCETLILLKPSKNIGRMDQAILAAYCCSYVKWQDAEMELQRIESIGDGDSGIINGLVLKDKKGNIKGVNPLLSISKEAQKDMIAYANQLGMTPAARIKILSPQEPSPSNPFSKLKDEAGAKKLDAHSPKLR